MVGTYDDMGDVLVIEESGARLVEGAKPSMTCVEDLILPDP